MKRLECTVVGLVALTATAVIAGGRDAAYEKIIADANGETAAYRVLLKKGGETVSSDPLAAARKIEKANLVYPVLYRPGKKLTGSLADWDDVPFEGTILSRMGGSSSKTPADLLPKFKACISDTSLFILLTAKDAKLAFARSKSCYYRNDCFEVYLDPLFTHAFAMGELVSQTFVTPADAAASSIVASGKLPWKTKPVACAGGWAAELELPLSNPYFVAKPFDGLRFGANLSYCNNDHPTKDTVTSKTGWSALDIGDNSYQTPGVYGVWTVVMDKPAKVTAVTEGPIIAENNVRRREGGSLEDPAELAKYRPSPAITRGFNSHPNERNCADCVAWGANNIRVDAIPFPVRYFRRCKTSAEYTACAISNTIAMCRTARRYGIKLIVIPGTLPTLPGQAWGEHADETIRYWTDLVAGVQGEKDQIWGFDLLNEPLDFKQLPMAPIEFRPFFCKALKAIRTVDKTSWLIYETGPGGEWDGFENLLPLPDPRIIYSCHFYKPGSFTHQGVDGSLLQDPNLTPKAQAGNSLTYPNYFFGRWFDRAEMERQLEPVIAFQKKWNVPIYVGEFSCASWGPKGSTAQYLADCTSVFEQYGWSWSYHNLNGWQGWNLDSADGVYTNLDKIPKDPDTLRARVMRGYFARNAVDAARAAAENPSAAADELPADLRVNKPDYVVFRPARPRGVPQTDKTQPSDTYNDHFHVFWDAPRKIFYAFWTQAGVESDPSQHICFSRSFDRGKTWTKPVILAGSPCAARPALVASWQQVMISKKGRIYCLWNQQTTSAGPHVGDMFGICSDDAGVTWSAPKKVALPRCDLDPKDATVPPSWCNWQPPQRFMPNGHFLVGASRHGQAPYDERGGCKVEFWEFANIDENPPVDKIKVIAHSTNREMLHVDESVPGTFKAKFAHAVEEAAIVKLPDGRLFAIARSSIGHPVWSQSRDGGVTWSPVKVLRDAEGKPFLHCRSPLPFFDWKGNEAGSGTYFALIHNTFDFQNPNAYQERGPLYLIAGTFDPAGEQPIKFSAPKLFAPRPAGNSFYASYTCVDGEGILWFNDCKFYLLGRKIGPEWFK